jgi:hypothetical protein
MDYKPDGLVFSDDKDYLLDIDYDLEEERLRSSFPKNKKRMNIIPSGPQPPDLSMYPESEQRVVLDDTLLRGSHSQTGITINV